MGMNSDCFRQNVRELCRLRGGQGAVAAAAGLSRGYLNRVLAGQQTPTLEVCEQVAKALHVPLEILISQTSVPPVYLPDSSHLENLSKTA